MKGRRHHFPAEFKELTEAERKVLIDGGVRLDAEPQGDPLAAMVSEFAALVGTSLTMKEAGNRLRMPESRVGQMIARGALYSFQHNSRWHIPTFQFAQRGGLVPNITEVNAALPEDLHPVEVQAWYAQRHPDLIIADDLGSCVSPLNWLRRVETQNGWCNSPGGYRVVPILRT